MMITLRSAFAPWRHIFLRVLAFLLCLFGGRAQSDLVLLEGPPEDFLAQGKTYRTADPFEIAFYGGESGIVVYALDFHFEFQPPANQLFREGVYTNVVRTGADPNFPGFSISGRGRGCNAPKGSFEIREFVVVDGLVERFWITFEHRCEGFMPPSHGEIRYRSERALEVPGARTLRVPQEFSSLSLAVAAAVSGDTIAVGPGTYPGGIDFGSKGLRLRSTEGRDKTFIEGPLDGTALKIQDVTNGRPSIEGFTFRHSSTACEVYNAAVRIVNNRFEFNGRPLRLTQSSGLIVSNVITDSVVNKGANPIGDAIWIYGSGISRVEYNRIERNLGGIAVSFATGLSCRNNQIRSNAATGIHLEYTSKAKVTQNVVAGNTGNGITVNRLSGGFSEIWMNTVAANRGAALSIFGSGSSASVLGNILSSATGVVDGGGTPFLVDNFSGNVVYATEGKPFVGMSKDLNGQYDNVVAHPQFLDEIAGDFRLHPSSKGVDLIQLPSGLSKDIDGNKRGVRAFMGGFRDTDAGAYEYIPGTPRPTRRLQTGSKPGSIRVEWPEFDLSTHYILRRASAQSGPFQTIFSGVEHAHEDLDVIPGQLYYYTVSGLNEFGEGEASAVAAGRAGNQPPQAALDAIETDEDTPVEIQLLQNDTDPDGDLLTYRILNPPAHGTLLYLPGSIRYWPEANWNGVESIDYLAVDIVGAVQQARITIRVRPVNDLPVLEPDGFTTRGGVTVQFTFRGSDVEGDPVTLRIARPPEHGSLSVLPGSLTCQYQPLRGFSGDDYFEVKALDASGQGVPHGYIVFVEPVPDADADGLPDVWERRWLLQNPDDDSDGDGMSNRAEYIANTSPTDPKSVLKLDRLDRPGGIVRLFWTAVGGTRYRVQSSDDALQWVDLTQAPADEIDARDSGSSGGRLFTDKRQGSTTGLRLYRLQLMSP